MVDWKLSEKIKKRKDDRIKKEKIKKGAEYKKREVWIER